MKIALFGATGMIGQRILAEALRRGHEVTAIARDPSKVTATGPGLHTAVGSVLDPQSVATLVSGQDAVVSAFSAGTSQPVESFPASARALIAGMTQAGVKRLIVVGGAGSLEVAPGVQLVDTDAIPEAWKPMVLAHRDTLQVLRAEGDVLDWTYFSPAAMIAPGERTGTFRLGDDQLLTDAEGNSRISAEDYAVALVNELEAPQHIRRRFTAAY